MKRSLFQTLALAASLTVFALACHGPAMAGEHEGGGKKTGEAKAGEAKDTGEAKVRDDDLHYIRLRGITATVFSDGMPAGALNVDIYLDLKDASKGDAYKALLPRLQDRYLTKINPLAHSRLSIYRPVDLDLITRALQSATDEVLGPGAAQVLISAASIRQF